MFANTSMSSITKPQDQMESSELVINSHALKKGKFDGSAHVCTVETNRESEICDFPHDQSAAGDKVTEHLVHLRGRDDEVSLSPEKA